MEEVLTLNRPSGLSFSKFDPHFFCYEKKKNALRVARDSLAGWNTEKIMEFYFFVPRNFFVDAHERETTQLLSPVVK